MRASDDIHRPRGGSRRQHPPEDDILDVLDLHLRRLAPDLVDELEPPKASDSGPSTRRWTSPRRWDPPSCRSKPPFVEMERNVIRQRVHEGMRVADDRAPWPPTISATRSI